MAERDTEKREKQLFLVKILIHMEGQVTTFQENRRNKMYGTKKKGKEKDDATETDRKQLW